MDRLLIASRFYWHRLLRLLLFCLFIPLSSFGQEYGLEFAGQPVVKDQRTKLDLTPEGYYSFRYEFELSFSIRLRDMQPTIFGYIARIVDNEGNNVDIIFNGPQSQSLQVVYDQSLTDISVPDNDPDIYERWTEVSLKYDIKNKTLQFNTPDTSILQPGIDLSRKVKIFFGRNDFRHIQTTDVPRMNIKEIRIYDKGICKRHFPLDEMSGNEAGDIISNKKAIVQNPGWIREKYYRWVFSFDSYMNGFSAMCCDPVDEKVYLVGDEQLKIYYFVSPIEDTVVTIDYTTPFADLIRASRAFYDIINNRLVCYNLEIRTVYYFNFGERRWDKISDGSNIPVRFWFHNKYYSGPDSVLYIFGGYSQHKYYKMVQQYDFKINQWDTLETGGDVFYPRMHAAIGYLADTLLILGGFGSKSGEQILHPEHYTDLMSYSLKDGKFTKKYDFQSPLEEIDFAHSMVIKEDDRTYYVLATTIYEYETYLQLLKGSLDNPELISVGDRIPYLFHNENSYCDLYYFESNGKLIAVTSLTNTERNETKFTVHKISFPPYTSDTATDEDESLLWKILIGALILLTVVTLIIILIVYLKKKYIPQNITERSNERDKAGNDLLSTNGKLPDTVKKPANSILFFGGFQVINKHGDDITKRFTPLLKELFLLIFLHSIKDKGISTSRLTELLWFSMDAKTAKNNRAVNIAKLKNLLSEIESCALSRKTSYWQLEFDDSVVYNDYWSCMKMIRPKESLSKEGLLQFLNITSKGPLLGNASYEWLDEFKLGCSNMIIDSLTQFFKKDKIRSDPELMIRLADVILIFDMMHEEAVTIKCKALTTLGKHSLAKEIFNKFSKEYLTLYDEPFKRSFTDIIKIDH